jgi:hypothetical protein
MLMPLPASTQDRWRTVEDDQWDTQSAVKIDAQRVRFFYISPFMEQQREMGIKLGLFNLEIAKKIKYGRYGVIVNCKIKESGFFSIEELDSAMDPALSPESIPMREVKMGFIRPETRMESLSKDVCDYFKIK